MNSGETSSAGPSRNPKSAGRKKRNRRKLKGIQHVSTLAIRRLARRGGVKRMSQMVYREMKEVFKKFLEKLVEDSVIYCEYDKRKTVMAKDVIQAMKCRGQRIYGFDDPPFPKTLRTSIRLTDTESTVTDSQLSSAEVTDTPVLSPVPGSSRTRYPSYRQATSTPAGNTRASSANVSTFIPPARNLRSTAAESRVPVPPPPEGNAESDQSDSDATVENLDLADRNPRNPVRTSSARNGKSGTPVTDEDFQIPSTSTVDNVQISNNGVGTHSDGDCSDEIIDYYSGIDPVTPGNPFDDNSH